VKVLNARQVGSVQRRIRLRRRPSKWGNPFVIGGDGSRDEVIAKYRAGSCGSRHSWRRCTNCAQASRVLVCAERCHADVLIELANAEIRQRLECARCGGDAAPSLAGCC